MDRVGKDQWFHRELADETHWVQSENPNHPSLLVFGPECDCPVELDRRTSDIAWEIANYLSGGKRPEWFEDFRACGGRHPKIMHPDGTTVTAHQPIPYYGEKAKQIEWNELAAVMRYMLTNPSDP